MTEGQIGHFFPLWRSMLRLRGEPKKQKTIFQIQTKKKETKSKEKIFEWLQAIAWGESRRCRGRWIGAMRWSPIPTQPQQGSAVPCSASACVPIDMTAPKHGNSVFYSVPNFSFFFVRVGVTGSHACTRSTSLSLACVQICRFIGLFFYSGSHLFLARFNVLFVAFYEIATT